MRDISLDWKCKHQKFICRLFLVKKEKQMCIKKILKKEREREQMSIKKEKKKEEGEKQINPWDW